jgi:hypothetical protein
VEAAYPVICAAGTRTAACRIGMKMRQNPCGLIGPSTILQLSGAWYCRHLLQRLSPSGWSWSATAVFEILIDADAGLDCRAMIAVTLTAAIVFCSRRRRDKTPQAFFVSRDMTLPLCAWKFIHDLTALVQPA